MVLRYILMPVALIAAAIFLMALHIIGTTIHHQLAWEPAVATIVASAPVQELRRNGSIKNDLDVTLRYQAAGSPREWSGRGTDVGIYTAKVGGTVKMYVDPADPTLLDTAAMKGWRGGVLVVLLSGGFTVLYTWFFWLRGRGGTPPSRSAPASAPPAPRPLPSRAPQQRRASFGNR